MAVLFEATNREWIDLFVRHGEQLRASDVVSSLQSRIQAEGGHVYRILPLHLLFPSEEAAVLADAVQRLVEIQTRVLRCLAETEGHEAILERFRVPHPMRRFVNWRELLNPEYLIGRHDILRTAEGYRICEFNIDSCVAGAEVFEFMNEFFSALGSPLAAQLGLVSPLQTLGKFIADYARGRGMRRIVILDWSAAGGSAGKGYCSYERMRAYTAGAFDGPVIIADERTYERSWLNRGEAERTLIHRGFMMDEMNDGGAFLDELLASGTTVLNTYESEIRMNKLWFAWLHDEQLMSILTREERDLIAAYIPRTWAVGPANVDELLFRKNEFFFKQSQSFGGSGIVIGDEMDTDELRTVLAATGLENWTAQEACDTRPLAFPDSGDFRPEAQNLVFGLYQYGARFNGMLLRASATSRIVNAGSGRAKIGWAMSLDSVSRQRALLSMTRMLAVPAREKHGSM